MTELMVKGTGPGGPENGSDSKSAPLVEAAGGRVRFTVQLTPGETTVVSWKKLLREANLDESGQPGPSVPGPSIEPQSVFVSEPLPPPPPPPPAAVPSHVKGTMENESKESQTNRLSNVIERIERMYAGNGISDEEDLVLDNMPDDDEYDTEDSFIDDTELDDYFQVDNSTIQHDGFFVNRGKLETIEPTISMDQQQNKRTRKDLVQGGGSDDGHNPHKIIKMGNKGRKTSSSIQVAVDPSGLQNGDTIWQQIPGVNSSENHFSKLKESELENTSTQKSNAKLSNVTKSHSGKLLNNVDGRSLSIQGKEKGGLVEGLNLNVAASEDPLPTVKESLMERTEGSSVRPKSADLEMAFTELEKIVEQFRPPSTEPQDPVNQSQRVKRRLPLDIKTRLGEVAIIAGAMYGRIPKDVINRLMGIVGHLMQITTLKRNVRAMANRGLSIKQQKEDQILEMKQEVAEMVKLRTMLMKSKLEQHGANSDDFQEADPEERDELKHKYRMDDVLENKICDSYDLYAETLDEDLGPSVRKLYEELALLWPSGFMHSDGIKRAIYRAKDRKGLCNNWKDRGGIQEKKVVLAPTAQDASNASQTKSTRKKVLSHDCDSTLVSNPVPIAAGAPVSSADKPKKEKTKKSISSSDPNPSDVKPSDVVLKRKVKRKPNAEMAEAKLCLEKLVISQGGETPQTRL